MNLSYYNSPDPGIWMVLQKLFYAYVPHDHRMPFLLVIPTYYLDCALVEVSSTWTDLFL